MRWKQSLVHSERNKAESEAASIMDGKILEFSADKYFDAGKAEGRNEGEMKMAALIKKLLADGKSGDMMRALDDVTYRKSLLQTYGY